MHLPSDVTLAQIFMGSGLLDEQFNLPLYTQSPFRFVREISTSQLVTNATDDGQGSFIQNFRLSPVIGH